MGNTVKHGPRVYKQMAMEVAVRNPDRYLDILRVLAKYENKILDDERILEIYADLYQSGVVTDMHEDFLEASFEDIKRFIKDRKRHNNEWGYPTGYQAAFTRYLKTLSELGFIYAQYKQPLRLSKVAYATLPHTYDDLEEIPPELTLSDAFALQTMRFWRKSPYRRVLNDFNFFDFVTSLIELREKNGHPMSVPQFYVSLFSLDGNVIEMSKLLDDNKVGHSQEKAYEFVLKHFGGTIQVGKINTAFRDYGNTVLRVLNLTGFISIDGSQGIQMIRINPERAELLHGLKNLHFGISEEAKESEDLYFEQLGCLPEEVLKFVKSQQLEEKPDQDLNQRLAALIESYSLNEKTIVQTLTSLSASGDKKNPKFPYMSAPLQFEFFIAMLLYLSYGDKYTIKPNYVTSSDGVPYSHAPGEIGDIEVFGQGKYWLIEVTLIRNKTQQVNSETTGLFRHIPEEQADKEAYLSLVAPSIHPDTVSLFDSLIIQTRITKVKNLSAQPQTTAEFVTGTINQSNFESMRTHTEGVIANLKKAFA